VGGEGDGGGLQGWKMLEIFSIKLIQFLYELGMFEDRWSILEKKYFCNKGLVLGDPPYGKRPYIDIFFGTLPLHNN